MTGWLRVRVNARMRVGTDGAILSDYIELTVFPEHASVETPTSGEDIEAIRAALGIALASTP